MKYVLTLARTISGGRTLISHHVMGEAGLVAGRQTDDIPLPDLQCSRNHAHFYFTKDGSLWVKDLDSRNGTYVDGVRIAKIRLAAGAAVRMGAIEYEVMSFQRRDEGATGCRHGDTVTGLTDVLEISPAPPSGRHFRFPAK